MDTNSTYHRKSIRLKSYDYGQAGMYYLTLCTHQRKCHLGRVVDGRVRLGDWGRVVQGCWLAIPSHFPQVRLDEYVIMPNHIHGIIVLKEIRGHNMLCPYQGPADASGCPDEEPGFRQARAWHATSSSGVPFGRALEGNVATTMRSFKGAATKEVRRVCHDAGIVLWQRNYYEHVIRSESELNAARMYIAENPAKWEADEEYVA